MNCEEVEARHQKEGNSAKDSGVVGMNGAAVHKAREGDKLIVASYVSLEEGEIDFFMPKILITDGNNRIKEIK